MAPQLSWTTRATGRSALSKLHDYTLVLAQLVKHRSHHSRVLHTHSGLDAEELAVQAFNTLTALGLHLLAAHPARA